MVTARLNVTQYEKTVDTLRYIHTKDPFNRQNESASVLAFLDETHPDTREATLGGFRMNAGNNVIAAAESRPIQPVHDKRGYRYSSADFRDDNPVMPHWTTHHEAAVANPYDRLEDAKDPDESE